MAAQLPQLAVNLGAVRERQVRHRVGEIIEPVDLAQQRRAGLGAEVRDEFKDRLTAVGGTVVDRL